jgi:hypothetical protein
MSNSGTAGLYVVCILNEGAELWFTWLCSRRRPTDGCLSSAMNRQHNENYCRVSDFLEKLAVPHFVNTFPVFYQTQMFNMIIDLTSASYPLHTRARCIHLQVYTIPLEWLLILFSLPDTRSHNWNILFRCRNTFLVHTLHFHPSHRPW